MIVDSHLCHQKNFSDSVSTLHDYFVQNETAEKQSDSKLCSKFPSKILTRTNNNINSNVNYNYPDSNTLKTLTKGHNFNCGLNSVSNQISQSVSERITSFQDDNNFHTMMKKSIVHPLTSRFSSAIECQSMTNINLTLTPKAKQRRKIDHNKNIFFDNQEFFTARAKSLDDVAK